MAIYSPDVQVDNPVTVAGGTIDASGSAVSVTNLPAVQPVSGTVSVGNFPATQPVSGSVSVSNLPATQPVSGSVSVSNFPATQPVSGSVTVSGTVNTLSAVASTATISQITSTGASQLLLAANANRKRAIIFFAAPTSSQVAFVKLGATASASSFTYCITGPNTTLEISGWVGQIDVLEQASGKLITVTELV